VKFDKLFIKDI